MLLLLLIMFELDGVMMTIWEAFVLTCAKSRDEQSRM